MEPVEVWDENGRCEHEKKEVAKKEITAPERQFNNLHDEFSRGLRHHMGAQTATIPTTGPPSHVALVMLEFSRKEDRDENLVDGPLNGNHSDKSENCMGSVPSLEEPLESR